jgi:NAD(P)-dependent dehydrogenase (short-subunit alcohol dehydrogenase family)
MPDVAVVTGAGRGIGARIAEELAARGNLVVVNTRSDVASATSVCDRIRQAGGQATVTAADVTRESEVAAMFERAARLGTLRILVNNAAFRTDQPVEEMAAQDFRRVVDVTLQGAFSCIQHALPLFARDGRIVNILGRNALAGDPRRVHVSAAKHGLLGLTLALAEALRARGITVNAVSPGIDTTNPVQLAECRARVALAVARFASADSAGLTGTVVPVDCPSGTD